MTNFVRLSSFNFRNHFIRHHNGEGELMTLDSGGPADDFLWEEVFVEQDPETGLNLVRLRSKNFRNSYLRHRDFRIYLEQDDRSEQFRKDSTFRRRRGRAGNPDDGWVSYEAVNWPGQFIRHRNFHLFMDLNPPKLKEDSTFMKVSPANRIDD